MTNPLAQRMGASRAASQASQASQRSVPMTGDDQGSRQKDDFYATPPWVTRALIDAEPFSGAIWEPAAGTGRICEAVRDWEVEHNFAPVEIVATDLVDRGYAPAQTGVDFLMEQKLLAPNVITNPPFKLAREFAQHAMDLGAAKCALLLKLGFAQGADRTPWLFNSGLARIWVIASRITFEAAADRPAFTSNFVDGYAWFVWVAGHKGPAMTSYLEKP